MPQPPCASRHGLFRALWRDRYFFLLVLPGIAYYVLFRYIPVLGNVLAFQDYSPGGGFLDGPWTGFRWFREFFGSVFFVRIIRNTLLLGLYYVIWSFPVPIVFALLLNELKAGWFKKLAQSATYLPYFISVVVVVGVLFSMFSPSAGMVNILLARLGLRTFNFMGDPEWFRTMYIGSGIWQSYGYNSVVYLAAITSIDPSLYEAAHIDGANRWQRMRRITVPGIQSTIVVMLLLSLGRMMAVGFEKILLMYSPGNYETSDVIATFVYRRGLINAEFSYGAAVGIFNMVINLALITACNGISRRIYKTSLW